MNTQTTPRPNYRIYDRTGGGVTEDIYADTLEDAIEQGRKWIEQGSWGSSDDGIYRTITLECEVREIVYRADFPREIPDGLISEMLLEPAWDEGRISCCVTPADTGWMKAALDAITGAEWGAEADADGDTRLIWLGALTVDETATNAGQAYDCSGTHSDDIPECEAAEDSEHDWRSPHALVGGLRENPGYWSGGGTISISKSVCRCCGCYQTETNKGSQCHESEARVIIEIEPRDSDSEEWLKETHNDDGWLPDWLATYLDCPPTVRMTEEQAREYVAAHDDDDEMDDDDLEHAFAALTGRRPDDTDRTEGLWSHLITLV